MTSFCTLHAEDEWVIEQFKAELAMLPEVIVRRAPRKRWVSASALDSNADLPVALVPGKVRTLWPRISWHEQAACAGMGTETFFGDDQVERQPSLHPVKLRNARATCIACPVQVECLRWALEHFERHGVWAGTSGRQRKPWFDALELVDPAERPDVVGRVVEQWLTR